MTKPREKTCEEVTDAKAGVRFSPKEKLREYSWGNMSLYVIISSTSVCGKVQIVAASVSSRPYAAMRFEKSKGGKLMENNWKAWIPDHDLENKYFICKAIDDEDGLRLFLNSNDYGKKICVQFPGMVYAYRNRLELAALSTLDEVVDKSRAVEASNWTFFVAENSAYAREVAKESQDIYPVSQLIHFAVVGGQALFEVITDTLPVITEGWEILI